MAAGKGRCAGCEETGDLLAIREHILSCAKWAALYRSDPVCALSAEDEHARWVREDRDTEREARRAQAMADTDDRKAKSVQRFKVADPLED